MTNVRVVAVVPVRGGELARGGLDTVAEAFDLAVVPGDCRVLFVGSGVEIATEELRQTRFAGAQVRECAAATFLPGRFAEALADDIDEDLVLLPASNDGRDLAPRLAALLGRELQVGAIRVTAHVATIVTAGGAALVDVEFTGPTVVTIQPGVRGIDIGEADPLAPNAAGPVATVPAFAAFASARDASVVELLPPDVATMDLADAPFILGAGAGLQGPEAIRKLHDVAERLGAAVGATRVVTDAGWVGHDRQIGTTGVVVSPTLYVAFGVSGAVQHTSGLGQPGHVISVNIDPHCPMANLADLAVVADAPAVVDELARLLADTGDRPQPTPREVRNGD